MKNKLFERILKNKLWLTGNPIGNERVEVIMQYCKIENKFKIIRWRKAK